MGGTGIRGHKKNPQLEGEDRRSEIMQENHERSKDESIRIVTKKNVK